MPTPIRRWYRCRLPWRLRAEAIPAGAPPARPGATSPRRAVPNLPGSRGRSDPPPLPGRSAAAAAEASYPRRCGSSQVHRPAPLHVAELHGQNQVALLVLRAKALGPDPVVIEQGAADYKKIDVLPLQPNGQCVVERGPVGPLRLAQREAELDGVAGSLHVARSPDGLDLDPGDVLALVMKGEHVRADVYLGNGDVAAAEEQLGHDRHLAAAPRVAIACSPVLCHRRVAPPWERAGRPPCAGTHVLYAPAARPATRRHVACQVFSGIPAA
jgi:hypothetical protein